MQLFIILLLQQNYSLDDPLAIIFSTSIGWHNYRQSANALSFYHKLKEFGMNDDQILMINP